MTVNQTQPSVPDETPDEHADMIVCEWCNEQEHAEDATTFVEHPTFWERRNGVEQREYQLCEACTDDAVVCGDCNNAVSQQYSQYVRHTDICDRCLSASYSFCDNCDEYYSDDYCSDCGEYGNDGDSEYGSSLIHDYSFRPEPFFYISAEHATTRDPRNISVTGFELEMEAVNCTVSEGAQLAQHIFGDRTYLKYDGSLSHGFEMVSHPLSRDYAINVFPYQRLRELSQLGMRSAQTRTCGLHIHINRSFFRQHPTTMYRFMSMFYQNADKWKQIAGRSESSYASWSEYELGQMLRYTKGLARQSHEYNSDRYVALNLQPRNTIELRFFKGTLRPQTFIARIEAAHAVAEYAYATRNNVSIKSAHDWERFREWTQRNGFTHFDTYANEKGV